jgi:LytS/YehU family sensor histidine kinase
VEPNRPRDGPLSRLFRHDCLKFAILVRSSWSTFEIVHTTIALSARRDSDELRLTLEDDGPGVRDGAMVREGIGLRNTRARLHHLYGAAASVQLRPASGMTDSRGTCVEIRIPFSEAPR